MTDVSTLDKPAATATVRAAINYVARTDQRARYYAMITAATC